MLDWILSALTLALGVTISHVTGTVLIQSPQVVKVPEGETVKFLCDLQSDHVDHTVDKYDVHWYYPESKESILSHYVNGHVYRPTGLSDRFQPSRDVVGNSYILTVRDVKLGDSAVYICGIWGTIFGNGTRLNVTSANAPVLIQSPSLECVTEGQTARLQCTMRNAAVTHTDVHWNRELPGKDMERVLTHDIKNNTQWSPGFTERFHPSRDTANKTFILTISNVQPSDTAVYYCSVWGDISGNGSQLNVTKQSSNKNPRTSDVIVLSTGIILAFVVLFCFALLTCYLVKKRLHSAKNSTQRIPDEDQNPVYATVDDKTRSSNQEVQEAPPAPLSGEGECKYAGLRFHCPGTRQPAVSLTESTAEYAVVQRS
ncbi:uncharacterized protein LOC119976739 [Scyliorhinus canicula]|uniref:uncharacterized protein LOC119976739 n=1 Tax=Scyliorhinus canicula TaxID=7830 RepID=UPI0018F751D1|nr:uncharacterized protein LOC119976739 [Scyliorhinus canicula]